MLHNTTREWGWLSKSFHWIIAIGMIVIVPVAYVMTATFAGKYPEARWETVHNWFSRSHQSIGLVILFLVIARLIWRWRNPVPEMPSELSPWQKALAKLNHVLLYAVLIIMPLSGWGSLSAYGKSPRYFLWWDNFPPLVPMVPNDAPLGFGFFQGIHHNVYYFGLGVFALHVIAALWHHFVKKDSVLRRMWPLAKP
jgi:cytochrome b561